MRCTPMNFARFSKHSCTGVTVQSWKLQFMAPITFEPVREALHESPSLTNGIFKLSKKKPDLLANYNLSSNISDERIWLIKESVQVRTSLRRRYIKMTPLAYSGMRELHLREWHCTLCDF